MNVLAHTSPPTVFAVGGHCGSTAATLQSAAVHASNGKHQLLGTLSDHAGTHGPWSLYHTFIPSADSERAGLQKLMRGNHVSSDDPSLGKIQDARLLSFMKACDGGKNICFVCIGVLPDTVSFVPLMGRGTRCLISCIERTTGEAAQGQCTVQLPSGVIEKERQTIAALPTLKVLTLLKRTSRKRRKVKGENPGEDETASGSASTPPHKSRRRAKQNASTDAASSADAIHSSPVAPATAAPALPLTACNGMSSPELQSKIRELSTEALRRGIIISMCPRQARQGRVTLDITSFETQCDSCGESGVWDDSCPEICLVGCMGCVTARHAKCIGLSSCHEWRCESCFDGSWMEYLTG